MPIPKRGSFQPRARASFPYNEIYLCEPEVRVYVCSLRMMVAQLWEPVARVYVCSQRMLVAQSLTTLKTRSLTESGAHCLARLAGWWTLGICLLRLQVRSVKACLIMWPLGIWTQVRMLERQVVYWLSHPPRLLKPFWLCSQNVISFKSTNPPFSVYVHMWAFLGPYVRVKGQISGVSFFLLRVLGIKLRLFGLCGKHFYLLSQLAGPFH